MPARAHWACTVQHVHKISTLQVSICLLKRDSNDRGRVRQEGQCNRIVETSSNRIHTRSSGRRVRWTIDSALAMWQTVVLHSIGEQWPVEVNVVCTLAPQRSDTPTGFAGAQRAVRVQHVEVFNSGTPTHRHASEARHCLAVRFARIAHERSQPFQAPRNRDTAWQDQDPPTNHPRQTRGTAVENRCARPRLTDGGDVHPAQRGPQHREGVVVHHREGPRQQGEEVLARGLGQPGPSRGAMPIRLRKHIVHLSQDFQLKLNPIFPPALLF